MKQYKYSNKEKNLITLTNEDKIYIEDPMYAFKEFENPLPVLIFNTDELIYDYEGNFKYFNKEELIQEKNEKSILINNIIDSIDVYIEKKSIRDNLIKEKPISNVPIVPDV